MTSSRDVVREELSFGPHGYLPPPLSTVHFTSGLRGGLIALSFFSVLSLLSTIGILYLIVSGLIKQRHDRSKTLIHNEPLLLITNLIIADFTEAVAGCISIHWLHVGNMLAPTAACSLQALLLHVGIICNGFFVLAIAGLTWLRVVRRTTLNRLSFFLMIGGIWLLGLVLALIGLMQHPRDFFATIGACCWVSPMYMAHLIYLACIWVFGSQAITVFIYAHIFINLRGQIKESDTFLTATPRSIKETRDVLRNLVLFPLVYLVMTLPLLVAMLMALDGQYVPLNFELVAGVLISCTGWIDCLLYTLTRKKLFFGDREGDQGLIRLKSSQTGVIGPNKKGHERSSPGSLQIIFPRLPRPEKPQATIGISSCYGALPLQQDTNIESTCSTVKSAPTRLQTPSPPLTRPGKESIHAYGRPQYPQRSETEKLRLRDSTFFPPGLGKAVEEAGSNPATRAASWASVRDDSRRLSAPARFRRSLSWGAHIEPYPGT